MLDEITNKLMKYFREELQKEMLTLFRNIVDNQMQIPNDNLHISKSSKNIPSNGEIT